MINELINYLELEKKFIDEDIELLKILPKSELVRKGLVILNCKIQNITRNEVTFQCEENNSKFKAGDSVYIEFENTSLLAKVIENSLDKIDVLIPPKINLDTKTLYSISFQKTNLLEPIISALKLIRPGMPGYFFYETIFGIREPIHSLYEADYKINSENLISTDLSSLDESQIEIIESCLKKPSLLAIQGPPGTGKTKILSIVANELSNNNLRVAILAPTHKAVNNCLNEIAENFENVELIKIGEELKSEEIKGNKIKTLNYYAFKKRLKEKKLTKNIIIGMTYYSAVINMGLRPDSFAPNVILIDEAAQIPLAYGIVAGLFGAGSIILFGDDAQMPPIFHEKLKSHVLSKSLFNQIRISSPSIIKPLKITYRLNNSICKIIGQLYYKENDESVFLLSSSVSKNNKLQLDTSLIKDNKLKTILDPNHSLIFISNDSEIKCFESNEIEADFIVKIIIELFSCGFKSKDIAVITPFRKQSIIIQSKLKNLIPDLEEYPIIDTVEKVQGVSVEIVIVSYASNDRYAILRMSDFLFSPNRLNVSISRARSKVIMFASKYMMEIEKELETKNQFEYIYSHSKKFNLNGISE